MKLNPNCVRDILIAVEENTGYHTYLNYPSERDKCPSLENYNDDEIRYHIQQCYKSGLIEFHGKEDLGGNIGISDLTPYGHSFLANIRSDNIWNNVKEVSSKVGSTSLSAITQIATGVVSALIKSHLGLQKHSL